jgi:hypothetical protein
MCTAPENAIRTGPRCPDQGGSATLPRLVSMAVSHTTRPIARSANRTASRLSTTGHHRGARPSVPAPARAGRACRRAAVCLVTAASSEDRSPAAVSGAAMTVVIREWLPATAGTPGPRAFTGTVIAIVRGGLR